MANANLRHVPKFPLYLLFTVYYFYTYISSFKQFFIHKNCFELFLTAHFLFWEIRNLNLIYAVCHTAISRKVVGKSACDKPERYYGWFWVHCSSKKFERMAQEAMDICLWVLKESNKCMFDSYNVRNSVLIISHTTFRDCRMHIFTDNLSRNSCIHEA